MISTTSPPVSSSSKDNHDEPHHQNTSSKHQQQPSLFSSSTFINDSTPHRRHLVRLELHSLPVTVVSNILNNNSNNDLLGLLQNLRELSIINCGLESLNGIMASFSSFPQLRALDLRNNCLKDLTNNKTNLLVNHFPILHELRLSGQKQSCLSPEEILMWTQATIIGHLQVDNLEPKKMLQFSNEVSCSCLFNVSLNNQNLQLTPPWSSSSELEDRIEMIEQQLMKSSSSHDHNNLSTADSKFINFIRTAIDMIRLMATSKQNTNNNIHNINIISDELKESSLANAWFDLRKSEQENWVLDHQQSENDMTTGIINKYYYGEQQDGSKEQSPPPFLKEENALPDFVLLKATSPERRRLIMKSVMKYNNNNKISSRSRPSSSSSSNFLNFTNKLPPTAATPEPTTQQQRRPSSGTKTTPTAVIHRTMSANTSVRRLNQEFTIIPSLLATKQLKQQQQQQQIFSYDNFEHDAESEQDDDEAVVVYNKEEPSPLRNKILIMNQHTNSNIVILEDFNKPAAQNNNNKKNKPASASKRVITQQKANLRSNFKSSEFLRAEKPEVNDPILFLSPAAFGIGSRYIISKIDLDNNCVMAKKIVITREGDNDDNKNPSFLSVKLQDINSSSSSWVSSKCYPPVLSLPLHADFSRDGFFTHDFVETRSHFVPLHQYLREQRLRRRRGRQQQKDKTEEDSYHHYQSILNDAEKYIEENNEKNERIVQHQHDQHQNCMYYSNPSKLVSPRTMLKMKRMSKTNNNEEEKKEKVEVAMKPQKKVEEAVVFAKAANTRNQQQQLVIGSLSRGVDPVETRYMPKRKGSFYPTNSRRKLVL